MARAVVGVYFEELGVGFAAVVQAPPEVFPQ
jgi:hypothetical protein